MVYRLALLAVGALLTTGAAADDAAAPPAKGAAAEASSTFLRDVTTPLAGEAPWVLLASGGIAGWHEPCG